LRQSVDDSFPRGAKSPLQPRIWFGRLNESFKEGGAVALGEEKTLLVIDRSSLLHGVPLWFSVYTSLGPMGEQCNPDAPARVNPDPRIRTWRTHNAYLLDSGHLMPGCYRINYPQGFENMRGGVGVLIKW
jgi:hypothetical protein